MITNVLEAIICVLELPAKRVVFKSNSCFEVKLPNWGIINRPFRNRNRERLQMRGFWPPGGGLFFGGVGAAGGGEGSGKYHASRQCTLHIASWERSISRLRIEWLMAFLNIQKQNISFVQLWYRFIKVCLVLLYTAIDKTKHQVLRFFHLHQH